MLNQVIIVGRVKEIKEEEKATMLILAVPRHFKNENGEYDTDYISCKLYGNIAENFKEYCKINDIVGIRGRLQTSKIDDKDILEVVTDKITFLSSKKESEEE